MKLYKIYLKNNNDKIEDISLVGEGISIWALVFGFFWLLYKRCWKYVAIVMFLQILIHFADENAWISENAGIALSFVISLLIAFNAFDIEEKLLLKKGYKFVGCVFGRDVDEARIQFLRNFSDYVLDSPPEEVNFPNNPWQNRQI